MGHGVEEFSSYRASCSMPTASLGQDASLSFDAKIQPTDYLIGSILVQFKEHTLT
jgi:hypothetical protein